MSDLNFSQSSQLAHNSLVVGVVGVVGVVAVVAVVAVVGRAARGCSPTRATRAGPSQRGLYSRRSLGQAGLA